MTNEVAVMERRLAVLGYAVVDDDRYNEFRRSGDTMFVLESIVRALAEEEPLQHYAYGAGGHVFACALCDGDVDGKLDENDQHVPEGPAEHTDGCPWRRAREWVDANPPRVNPGFRL